MKDLLYPVRLLHGRLHDWRVNVLPLYKERFHNPKAVYLVLTPEHGNLGDHAIAQAEERMLQELNIPFIEVTGKQLESWKTNKCLNVMNGRPILIHGGGYLGTLWINEEYSARLIIERNTKSNIIFLPNTIYYEDNDFGESEKIKSQTVYNKHKRILFYARERQSYALMSELYKRASLAPDMVLSLNKSCADTKREGCILCLRKDCEKTRTESIEAAIRASAAELFGEKVFDRDMVVNHTIPVSQRDEELEKQFSAFRKAELVITDRLHGMIFSAITGTPCIVIDSKSPKVRGCYEWIKDLPYIQFCDDVTSIPSIYNSIPQKEWQYDNSKLLPLFEPLKEDILAVAKRKKSCR